MSTFLTGERTVLRSLQAEDMPFLQKWLNDPEITYTMFSGQHPMSPEQVHEEWSRLAQNPAHVVFIAVDRETSRPIGTVGLYDIHPTARKAEFRILIGEKEFWNKGYGTEMTELVHFYAFDRLNLNKVYLGVTRENLGAVRSYEKAGYQQEGVLRQDLYRNSRYYDTVRMSILRDEYYKLFYEQHRARFGTRPPQSR